MAWFRSLFCPKSVYERRHQLSAYWVGRFDCTVRYGPFSGLNLGRSHAWSSRDLASKLFGVYEQEVTTQLVRVSKNKRVLIDIGAADGYYAVGAVLGNLFERCIAFEANQESRRVLENVSELNGVRPKLEIHGLASEKSILRVLEDLDLSQTVMLVDIEGGEFELFTNPILQRISLMTLVIELHDWMVDNGVVKKESLILALEKTHSVRVITDLCRDLTGRNELDDKNDDHRWLICSEGRGRKMEWLICEPLSIGEQCD